MDMLVNNTESIVAIDDRTGLQRDAIRQSFINNLFYVQGKFPKLATTNDYYMALAHTVRDRLLQRWVSTAANYTEQGSRTVAYLSAEFLMGPHLGNNLINLDIYELAKEAMAELDLDLDLLLQQEEEPGLGNGGLGRLAACFLDSMATLEIPALGYGIRYEFGIFDQEIVDGWQKEKTDKWLRFGNPWEIIRPEWAVEVKLGGHTEHYCDFRGRHRVRWVPGWVVKGIPYDTPILGYRKNTANTLRLWRAEAPESFDFETFNRGDYYGAVDKKVISENITKVLYPNDEPSQGRELRLQQQFFFVSCSLQDMLRIMGVQNISLSRFHEKFAVQLNDTHPSVAVLELMRLLIDERGIDWDTAWSITRKTFAYTNHTLLPEALERWPVQLFGKLLPRHLELLYEINEQFLDEVRIRFIGDDHKLARLSLIDERGERNVRMAHLACVGSHAINGVAELHSELLKSSVLKDFYDLWPEKFSNKTNGVTPRRWVVLSNPRLSSLLTETLGEEWIVDLQRLRQLESFATDSVFMEKWRNIKYSNKCEFSKIVRHRTDLVIDPGSMFDVQVKRIHEYKRQHLNLLHIIGLYNRIKSDPHYDMVPRTFIFGGKAAPSYYMAKLIIKLITSVSKVIERDPVVRDRIKVVFLPNYNVTNGQRVYPAADLSEQISTAGKEASGTGNMKFAMNGALTVGTLDGANIEIRDEVGADNFYLFGLTEQEVVELKENGYRSSEYFQSNDELRDVINFISSGLFSKGDTELFKPLIDNLLHRDPYMVLADYESYADCQVKINNAYTDQDKWSRMAILNCARSGKFSSDRSIQEYCDDIWQVSPQPIQLLSGADVRANSNI